MPATKGQTYNVGWAHDCLYDVPYQVLRMKCIKNWTTQTGAEANIVRLLRYIGRASDQYWRMVRVWRVKVAIQAAKKSLDDRGLQGPSRVCATALTGLDREFMKLEALNQAEWRARRHPAAFGARDKVKAEIGPFRKWDWNITRTGLERLFRTNRGMFDTLQRHYEGRAYGNPNPDFTRMRMDTRLAMFVRMMRDVKFELEDEPVQTQPAATTNEAED